MSENIEESRARFEELFSEMFSESDRGCILIGASVLDELLSIFLKLKLNRNDHVDKHATQPLFSGMGPLSTFSARIKLAYCLGLIEQWEFEDLERIRRIRNRAAHEYSSKTFSNNDIVQLSRQLMGANHAVVAMEKYKNEKEYDAKTKIEEPKRPVSMERLRFQFTVIYMAGRFDMLGKYQILLA